MRLADIALVLTEEEQNDVSDAILDAQEFIRAGENRKADFHLQALRDILWQERLTSTFNRFDGSIAEKIKARREYILTEKEEE